MIPAFVTLASFNGLVKALTGVRYGPLLIDAGLLLLLGLGLATQLSQNRLRIGALDFLALGFLVWAVFGMFNPNIPSFMVGLEGFRKFAFMIVGFFLGRSLMASRRVMKGLILSIVLTSFLISLYGVKQYLFPSSLDYRLIELSSASPITFLMGGHIRAFSTMAGPFHLGIYLVCSILLLFIIGQQRKRWWLWLVILGIPQILALIMTVTKSNWYALIAGILILILLEARRPLQIISRFLFIGIAAAGLVGIVFAVSRSIPGLETVNAGITALLNPLQAPTFLFRLNLWQEEVIPLMLSSPLLGHGTGSAGEGLASLFEGTRGTYITSHNLYFKLQLEYGMIGLTAFFVFIFAAIWQILRIRHRLNDPFLRGITHWALGFSVAVAISGLTGAILDAYPANLIFWLLLGVSTRLHRIQSNEVASEPARPAAGVSLSNPQALSE